MHLNTSYKQILSISLPIMLGSAVQNVIALSDSVFLYHLSEGDYAAIGFVGVFYLIIAAIGFGFSRGGQILIARREGEQKPEAVGRILHAMCYFELGLAVIMFLFMQFGVSYFFSFFVDSPLILGKSLAYLEYRSYGVFFSYAGVALIAFYTGIARTWFIIVDTILLALVNIVLNYGLIYGALGLPEMGIAGAGLASTIAEVVAFICFVCYIIFDRSARKYQLFKLSKIDWKLIKAQLEISTPIVAQSIIGLGSWFVFFGIVENMGERELAITNLVRNVYLILSIPCWGFATGVNTLVSYFIGQGKRQAVVPIIWKTSKACLFFTLLIALPVAFFPEVVLYPLFGGEDMSLIHDAQQVLYVLLGIIGVFSIGGVYFNGLIGTGAVWHGLKLQFICAFTYIFNIYLCIEVFNGGLELAWATEIFYWFIIALASLHYLRSKKWYNLHL